MASKPTVDLSEFYKLSRPKKKPCSVGWVLSQLSEPDAGQLVAALAVDKGIITAGAVRGWAKARHHDLNLSAVVSHRNGTCSCGEEAT